ncbi:MAG: biotin/lipoyl-containing protein [Anaerolineae bacterium]
MTNKQYELTLEGVTYRAEVQGQTVLVNGRPFSVTVDDKMVQVDGTSHTVELEGQQAIFDGIARPFQVRKIGEEKEAPRTAAAPTVAGEGVVTAIMPGKIVRVLVQEGDQAAEGDVVCVLEAMKMENELQAPRAGEVKAVHISPGDDVEMGAVLVEIE